MDLFELTKIMFENPSAYKDVMPGEKRKHFFMINRRMAIKFPLQANELQHVQIDEVGVIDFWQDFLRKQYTKTPYWMYTKGVKKSKEQKEKKLNIKESIIKQYSNMHLIDLKSIYDAIKFFPDQIKKELNKFEKIIS